MKREYRPRTRGEGAFGMIVGIVVAVVTLVAGFKIVPLHIHGNEVKDAMNEQANFGGLRELNKLQYAVYEKAQEVGAPLPLTEIKVSKRGSNIVISAKYTQEVKVFGYKYVYNFDESVEKPLF